MFIGTRGFPKKSFSNKKKGPHLAQRHDSNSAFRRLIAAYFFKEKRPTHDLRPAAFQKNSSSNKTKKLWIDPAAFQKKSFSNKKKGPHPAQCHDSNSAFRRLIAAYFF